MENGDVKDGQSEEVKASRGSFGKNEKEEKCKVRLRVDVAKQTNVKWTTSVR